ncbi:hypothetical protein ACVW0P_004473 [Mucilaginibacter sp. UYNi724]
MTDRFTQRRIIFDNDLSTGMLKVSKLLTLLDQHPYLSEVTEAFRTEEFMDETIVIGHIDQAFNRIKEINKNFERFNIVGHIKDITIRESKTPVANLSNPLPLIFNFTEYKLNGEENNDMDCYAIYDAKNTFFDAYEMSKFANHLYKTGLGSLAAHNLEFFKDRASNDSKHDSKKSYRLVLNDNEVFFRGITSIGRYYEYGIDFTFVIAMLLLHQDIKRNEGNQYAITSAAVSESKLELIIADKNLKDGGEFGQVSSAIVVTTNDLGQGALNFTKIIRVGVRVDQGIYLYPKSENARENKLVINHSTGPDRAIKKIKEVQVLLNNTNEFITELHDINSIQKPEELRGRIFNRLNNPRSAFKDIHTVRDIFKTKINDEIKDFVKLLEMCNKAEELDIDYDLKEKLRYLISDIILNRKSGS